MAARMLARVAFLSKSVVTEKPKLENAAAQSLASFTHPFKSLLVPG